MKEHTCCFTGHRKIEKGELKSIQKKLTLKIKELIDEGVVYFGAGGALGFDTIAAETVIKLRKKYKEIKLILVLPCKEQADRWDEKDIKKYNEIIKKADKVVYTSDYYFSGCMFKRNRHLVDNSSYCIAYLKEDKGGTAYTVNYARGKGLTIYNIAE